MIQLYHRQIVSFKTYHQPCSGTWFKRLCQLRQENSPPNKQWNLICADVTLHPNYFIPVGNTKQPYAINWGLSDVHVC